ncbi:SGNH/GDSL hydrolase family protein [Granulicella cerasi]|uniref:SGNH/GDSL hydrolase family protein n=1 Tax=Granulicella cerasi TaxID=741063 RepID=A0ABW1Z4R5_9BACT|nr:SGNH/GDSL hydrolase family protein [Granulicella cerasi]
MTGFTTVSGAHLQDASGTLVTNSTIKFQPVDNNGRPLSFRAGGDGGQVIAMATTATVTNGTFTTTLADTTLTTPVNVGYRVTVVDNVTGDLLLSHGYECVQPSGVTWDFDSYAPNLAAQNTVQYDLTAALKTLSTELGFNTVTSYGDATIACNNTTPTGIFAGVNTSVATSGALKSITYQSASSGGTMTFYLLHANSGGLLVVDDVWTITVPHAGTVKLVAGVDFSARNVSVGQYLGYYTATNATATFGDGTPGPGFIFVGGNPGAVGSSFGVQSMAQSGELALAFEVQEATVDVETVASTAQEVVTETKRLSGLRFGVFGDSISAQFANQWQQRVCDITGMTWVMQDARYARYTSQIFENYTLSGGVYTRHDSTTSPASNLIGVATGNTLAQDLANVDVLFIELLTNTPTNTFGSSTDAPGTASAAGDISTALQALFTAKPTLRIVWITPYQANPGAAAMASQSQFVELNTLIKQIATLWGIGIVDGGAIPINPSTWSTYLRDGVHPTDSAYQTLYGPCIAAQTLALLG